MISEHITEAEAFKSQTATRKGINNTTTDANILANMKHVAELFEAIRKHFNKPIGISSFYRCDALNKAVGGARTSQHVKGEAIDIDRDIFGGVKNSEIFEFAKTLDFDQLLWEFGNEHEPDWVHISRKRIGTNRKQILVIK
jgi:uncharacterized protein YcbK (DUF882 family)